MTKKELVEKLEEFNDLDEIVFQEHSAPPIPITEVHYGNIYASGIDQPLIILSPDDVFKNL